ncbi:MAG: hypothetical protein GXP63_06805 [DPANN group archaeon]|nr:hypothetical protein [DPANN group archaeon]
MNRNISLFLVAIVAALLFAFPAQITFAQEPSRGHSDLSLAEALITSNTPCDSLSDDQFELVGEYYMEQMHPGEAHEQMDAMMGGEGSASLRSMHIRMAKVLYCGESGGMGSDMMGMMGGMMNDGMMKGGMMGRSSGNSMMGADEPASGKDVQERYTMMGNSGYGGMMGGSGWFGMSIFWLVYLALASFIFGIVFWWTHKLMNPDKQKK